MVIGNNPKGDYMNLIFEEKNVNIVNSENSVEKCSVTAISSSSTEGKEKGDINETGNKENNEI